MHIRNSKVKGVSVNFWKVGASVKPDVLGFVLI